MSPTSPAPTPSPPVTSAGYLHVLQRPWVVTYEIDPTGRLRPPVTQHVSNELFALAGEPRGRFVYGAHGGWSLFGNGTGGGSDLTIATYAPDPRDGTLVELSYATVAHRPSGEPCISCFDIGEWTWLNGGVGRAYGLWLFRWGTTGRHKTYTYASVAVAGDGRLGPVIARSFMSDTDPGQVLVDVRSDQLYKAGRRPRGTDDGRGGLEAHVIEADGTLTRTGWTNLCLGSTMCEYCAPSPLVSARGFVFASVLFERGQDLLCSYQGLRLKPLDALDFAASAAAAFVPSSEADPALLAMNVDFAIGGLTRHELRLFSMSAEGDLRPLDSEELPDPATRILFHPSRPFLYVVDKASQLRAYAVDANGRLERLMIADHAGGSIAITHKDAWAEDR